MLHNDHWSLAQRVGAVNALSTTVLIADDEIAIAFIVARIISSMGLSTIIVYDGAQAVQVAQTMPDKLSCVILDVLMPGTNGIDAAEKIRHFLPDLPIVLMSGNIPPHLIHRVNTLPHSAFLQKPFTLSELKSLLTQLLQSGHTP